MTLRRREILRATGVNKAQGHACALRMTGRDVLKTRMARTADMAISR
jgi:hypothetical protein